MKLVVRKDVYNNYLDDIDFQKSRGYGIGTIREWRGKKYKKVAPGKWREVYDKKQSRNNTEVKEKSYSKDEKINALSNYMHMMYKTVSVEDWKEQYNKIPDVELDKRFSEFTETHTPEKYIDKYKKQLAPTYGRKQIAASKFKAADYKKVYDDESINADNDAGMKNAIKAIMELPIVKKHPEFEMKFRYDLERANKEPETVTKFRKSGEGTTAIYTPEREKLHNKIIGKLIAQKYKAAKPKDGEQPTFQILGGRGGSGKSTFNKKKSDAGVYNEDNVIVIDPDALKEELANESGEGWEGWKAKAYHEESSDLSKKLMKVAKSLGLNIVMDITMSSADKQIDELKQAKAAGYKTGAYYMHVPKQESLKRAIKRYIENPDQKNHKGVEDFTGRFVPPDVLLNMTGNEANFDKVKNYADDWSFYDNFIPFEKNPETGKNKYTAEKIAQKGEEV